MQKVILFLVSLLLLSCGTRSQSSLSPQNTIKIEEGDTKEVIIEKAAHVIPTENQLDALRNEFIAFIHFGPNTLHVRNGEMVWKIRLFLI